MARPDRFEGRTVVVTGGAGGIGRAVCAGFAAEGAAVAVLDVDPASVAETANAIHCHARRSGGGARRGRA